MTHKDDIHGMTIDEICMHPQFYHLTLEKPLHAPHWFKICFEATEQLPDGSWKFLGDKYPTKHVCLWKHKYPTYEGK